MDWAKASELIVAFLLPFAPFLVKVGEGAATEFGKKGANKIAQTAQNTWDTIKRIFTRQSKQPPSNLVEQLKSPGKLESQLTLSLEEAAKDPVALEAVNQSLREIRNIIYDTIVNRFMLQDLQKLHLRMGIGFDDLVMGTNPGLPTLAMSLVDDFERHENGLRTVVNALMKSRPDLAVVLEEVMTISDPVKRKQGLAEVLTDRLTAPGIQELYFRLGVGTDEVVQRAKARALIQHAETRSRLPELVQNMWIVNPTLFKPD